MVEPAMSSIFICHSSRDKEFVRILKTRLSRFNIRVWVDEDEIKGGESLIIAISNAISEMEYLGVVLSPNAVQSKWVQEELELALNQQIEKASVKVIPILLRQCEIPSFLKGKKYINFTGWNKRKGDSLSAPVEELVKSLGVDPRDAERWSGRRIITVENLRRRLEEYFAPLSVDLRIFEDNSGIDKIVVDNKDGTYQLYSYWSRPSYIDLINEILHYGSEKPIVDIQMIEEILWTEEDRDEFIANLCKKYSITESEFWDAYRNGSEGRKKLSKNVNSACLVYDKWILDQTPISLVHKGDFGAPQD